MSSSSARAADLEAGNAAYSCARSNEPLASKLIARRFTRVVTPIPPKPAFTMPGPEAIFSLAWPDPEPPHLGRFAGEDGLQQPRVDPDRIAGGAAAIATL